MIISKKKYQEDIRKAVEEAVNRVEHEAWVRSSMEGIERNTEERIDGVMRHVLRLEERLEALDHSKERKLKETAGLIEWKACPICLRMRRGED